MAKYAEIIIDISTGKLDHPFTYRVPEELSEKLSPGSLVEIPFGKGNTIRTGYVIELTDRTDCPPGRLKNIARLSDKTVTGGAADPGVRFIHLAAWMKEHYGSTMISALKTVMTGRKAVKRIEQKQIRLLLDNPEAQEKLTFYQKKHQVARARLLEKLIEEPCQPYELITGRLHISPAVLRAMADQRIIAIDVFEKLRNPITGLKHHAPEHELSPEQRQIVDGVLRDFENVHKKAPEERKSGEGVSLIHGITGSGKTLVYISIIREIVSRGYQAVMLIPEISLTYQTVLRFYQYFGDRVSVMNSELSPGEKSDQMERAAKGELDVIIGPRSALFTPFPRTGVIVIDEEHENSYKNEAMPKYHTRETAIRLAAETGAVVVLGSATPSIDTYQKAVSGEYRLYELTRRLTGGTLPEVEIADMRSELRAGNRSILSAALKKQLEERLEHGEQTMLFLNRRGYSGFVSCRNCGHVFKCPHCDVSLSLHYHQKMTCHYCGYVTPAPSVCPECGSAYVSGFRAGTEKVEEFLKKEYPEARILRMDADTTSAKGSYEKILSAFSNEEADILIGTQMIVKGHDFPKVTLVGILMADLSLYANDYRASERTFQLLTQAAGRAGRGERKGRVVIQTYEPEHYAIEFAAAQDYMGFYREEAAYRKVLSYPPAAHMLSVQIQSRQEDEGLRAAAKCREWLEQEEVLLIGPAPASLGKLKDIFRYALYIKHENYAKLIICKDILEEKAAAAVRGGQFAGVTLLFDFDPVNPY